MQVVWGLQEEAAEPLIPTWHPLLTGHRWRPRGPQEVPPHTEGGDSSQPAGDTDEGPGETPIQVLGPNCTDRGPRINRNPGLWGPNCRVAGAPHTDSQGPSQPYPGMGFGSLLSSSGAGALGVSWVGSLAASGRQQVPLPTPSAQRCGAVVSGAVGGGLTRAPEAPGRGHKALTSPFSHCLPGHPWLGACWGPEGG